MNKDIPSSPTFAFLDKLKGLGDLPEPTAEEYPLPAWYRAVRETPIENLGVEDICKACRQQIHLEHVVPLALRRLKANSLAGEMYEGELLVSLKTVPAEYWSGHVDEAGVLMSVIEAALKSEIADLRQDLNELREKVAASEQGP